MNAFPRITFALLVAALAFLVAPAPAFADDGDGGSGAAGQPSSTPLLVLVVGFDGGDDPAGAVPYREDYDWADSVFGAEGSVVRYYADMSGGRFTFAPAHETSAYGADGNANVADAPDDGVVHVTLHGAHDGWATVNEESSVTRAFCWKAMEMLQAASAYVNFSAYDANSDGQLEDDELVVVLCIAGYEASAMSSYRTTDLPVIWAHSGDLQIIGTTDRTLDGLRFGPYLAFAEQYWNDNASLETAVQQPVGMLCHELGHTLGLPDLYAIDDGTGDATWGDYAVGGLSLLAEGCLVQAPAGYGAKFYPPAAMDAWSRYELGWTAAVKVTQSGDYTVSSQMSESGYGQLLVPTLDSDRFYLVENRQPEGYDESFQTSYEGEAGGIVVWQVDESLVRRLNDANEVNAWSHHPGVMPLYYEMAGGAYSMDWAASAPSTDEPFYSGDSWAARFGEAAPALRLPAYGADGQGDTPSARAYAGTSIAFTSAPGRDMTVHVELDEAMARVLLKDELSRKLAAQVLAFFA